MVQVPIGEDVTSFLHASDPDKRFGLGDPHRRHLNYDIALALERPGFGEVGHDLLGMGASADARQPVGMLQEKRVPLARPRLGRVRISVSDTYAPSDSIGERWADFFAGLLHGDELRLLHVSIAPLVEVQELCGSRARRAEMLPKFSEDEPPHHGRS
jgi:hypothetical protein